MDRIVVMLMLALNDAASGAKSRTSELVYLKAQVEEHVRRVGLRVKGEPVLGPAEEKAAMGEALLEGAKGKTIMRVYRDAMALEKWLKEARAAIEGGKSMGYVVQQRGVDVMCTPEQMVGGWDMACAVKYPGRPWLLVTAPGKATEESRMTRGLAERVAQGLVEDNKVPVAVCGFGCGKRG